MIVVTKVGCEHQHGGCVSEACRGDQPPSRGGPPAIDDRLQAQATASSEDRDDQEIMLEREAERRARRRWRAASDGGYRPLPTPGRNQRRIGQGADKRDLLALADMQPRHRHQAQRRIRRAAMRAAPAGFAGARHSLPASANADSNADSGDQHGFDAQVEQATRPGRSASAIQNHRGGLTSMMSAIEIGSGMDSAGNPQLPGDIGVDGAGEARCGDECQHNQRQREGACPASAASPGARMLLLATGDAADIALPPSGRW